MNAKTEDLEIKAENSYVTTKNSLIAQFFSRYLAKQEFVPELENTNPEVPPKRDRVV